jgi:hypothetical protein
MAAGGRRCLSGLFRQRILQAVEKRFDHQVAFGAGPGDGIEAVIL